MPVGLVYVFIVCHDFMEKVLVCLNKCDRLPTSALTNIFVHIPGIHASITYKLFWRLMSEFLYPVTGSWNSDFSFF